MAMTITATPLQATRLTPVGSRTVRKKFCNR